MPTPALYWTLWTLAPNGHSKRHERAQAETLVRSLYQESARSPERQLERDLVDLSTAQGSDSPIAELCLRCYISYLTVQVCKHLANQFGDYYGFTEADLLPYVLDDDGRPPSGPYRPLSLQILDSFDSKQASLNTWATRLIKQHPELNRFLNEQGLYMISDWALLNNSTIPSLPRILSQFHQLSALEVQEATLLLESYHAVYRRDRLLKGQKDPCSEPTAAQLQEIGQLIQTQTTSVTTVPTLTPKQVFFQLQTLAKYLRDYRLSQRGATRNQTSLDVPDSPDLPDPSSHGVESAQDHEQEQAFLSFYQNALVDCLRQALETQITKRFSKLAQAKQQSYLTALDLFHCKGMAMGAIAKEIGLKAQYQVTRLLKLKELRTDVRHLTITHLQAGIQEKAKSLVDPEQLRQLDQRIESFLAEAVDALLQDDAENARKPKQYQTPSRFATEICHLLDQQFLSRTP